MLGTPGASFYARVEVVACDVREGSDLRREQVAVNELSLARLVALQQRREDGAVSVET